MTPLLSVIVPVYNTEKYLKECVDSILAQTYKDYELILVDDGSTDASPGICDEYAEKYEHVTVIHKKNCGLLHTRKAGLAAAKGEYISYIDSDDFIAPDMYEYMMSRAVEYDVDVAICNLATYKDGETEPKTEYNKQGFYDKKRLEEEIYPYMLFCNAPSRSGLVPSLCNKIIRKKVLDNVLMHADDSISYGEDALCSYPCVLDSDSMYLAEDKFFYFYRQVPTSLTNSYDKMLLDKFNLLINLLDEAFAKRGFDGKRQLDCYASIGSLECIRKELLFNREKKIGGRIENVREYVSRKRIKEAFDFAAGEKFNLVAKIKILLIKHRWFHILYLSLYLKYLELKRKEQK